MRSDSSSLHSGRYLPAVILAACLLLFTDTSLGSVLAEEISVEIEDEELSLLRFNAKGDHLIIWVSPGFGNFQRALDVANAVSKRGIEVWHIDLAESLFLPQGTRTLRTLDGRYVAKLIEHAHEKTGKKITLMTRSYAALPVLRGARLWQIHSANNTTRNSGYLTGAILFSPELYSEIPPLGMDPVYDPIASSTNIPIMLYQASQRGNRWQLDKSLEHLRSGGSSGFLIIFQGVGGVLVQNV